MQRIGFLLFGCCLVAADVVGSGKSVGYLYLYAVAQTCGDGMAGVGLLGSVGEQLDKGTVVLEGYCILGHGQHLLALVEHYLGVGAIARPNHHAVRYRCCPFYLEHHRAVALCPFGGDILQCAGKIITLVFGDFGDSQFSEDLSKTSMVVPEFIDRPSLA